MIKVFGWSLLINGAIGAFVFLKIFGISGIFASNILAFLGVATFSAIISGIFTLRSRLWAIILGILFYGLQVVRYSSGDYSITWLVFTGITALSIISQLTNPSIHTRRQRADSVTGSV